MVELLISRKDGELLLSVDLTGRTKLTVGRSPRCEITLDAPSVSRRHAILIRHRGHWMLIDTGSMTGTFAGEEQARCLQLTEDGWARIGPAYFWLDGSGEDEPLEELLSPDALLPLAEEDPLLHGLPVEEPQEAQEAAGAVLTVTDLTGKPLRRVSLLGRERLTVGRSRRCDLTLPDPEISRLHCVLYLEGQRWCVADAGSATGTRVEGRPTHRRRLEDDMLIRIGSHLMRLDGSNRGSGRAEEASALHVSAFLGPEEGEEPAEPSEAEPASRPVRKIGPAEGKGPAAKRAG
jgi:pSer/pThr/pTyr-binding forkhead associated (FHA) protein